ncbi:MAG: hypothetical protein H0W40_19235 [Methylibium sp.]|uniref:PIN domain-containing protein n=1 Tax=Methylibium sp. TaxID=2067992 RepID=UPI0018436A0E|nr:PIN domain-containing protein [Methylibium sp.]MBA3599480.1 hypothetical protein [Methylibium sp.]
MNDRFLLVDLESIQPVPGDVEAWMAQSGSAWVFHGPHQRKALPRYAALGERITLVPISRPGKNSLDFHLVFYLGYLTARNPNAKFAVLSKDTDYDPAIEHARMLAFDLLRIEHLGPTDAVAAQTFKAAKKPALKKQAATKPPAAPKKKTAPAKKVPVAAKKAAAKKAAAPPKATVVPAKRIAPATSMKSSGRMVGAIYRDVLQGLREQVANRPRSREALERHVGTKFGIEPAPEKARAVVDRLFTVEAVRQEGRQLVYFPNDPVTTPSAAAVAARASANPARQ